MKSINWGLCCIINVSQALSGTNVAMYIQWRENYVCPFVKLILLIINTLQTAKDNAVAAALSLLS